MEESFKLDNKKYHAEKYDFWQLPNYQKDNYVTEFLYQRQSVHRNETFQSFVATPILMTHRDTDLSSNNGKIGIFLLEDRNF